MDANVRVENKKIAPASLREVDQSTYFDRLKPGWKRKE